MKLNLRLNEYVAVIDADSIIYTFSYIHINTTDWKDIKKSVDRYINGMLDACNTDKYVMCVEGEGNFRKSLKSFSTVYKGSRVTEKPYWFTKIKNYLINNWKSEVAVGIETDDIVTILVTNLDNNSEFVKCILCRIDKDLDQVADVLHYNYKTKKFKKISKNKALLYLWQSMLQGDTADNIKGVPGIGMKTLHKILKGKDINTEVPGIVFQEYWNYWVNKKSSTSNVAIIEFCTNWMYLYMLQYEKNINQNLPKIQERVR